MSQVVMAEHFVSAFAIKDLGLMPVRQVKEYLTYLIGNELVRRGDTMDGAIGYRFYAQNGFSEKNLLFKSEPWIPGTPLPEWAIVVRVRAEAHIKED